MKSDNKIIELHVYTDASGNKKTSNFGYAATFMYKEVKYFHSYSIEKNDLQFILNTAEEVSNPTVEVFAFVEFLGHFLAEININKYFEGIKIIIYSDYIGVPSWYNKEWMINKDYIKRLIRQARAYVSELHYDYNIDIEVKWVKGHIGISGNEEADRLAGLRLNKSNFREFFKTIKLCLNNK